MADWLKIRHSLIRSPKIYALARELKCKKHAALGVALAWLVWLDEQTEDGRTHLSPDELADEIGFRGCAEALIAIGWAALGCDGCVEAVEFDKHCGESAKKRAENALRKAKSRAGYAEISHKKRDGCHEKSVTNVTQKALPEKKRKEENNKTTHTPPREGAGGVQALPRSVEEVLGYMHNMPHCGLQGPEAEACARKFFDSGEECGWLTKNGLPINDWRASCRKWVQSWQLHERYQGASPCNGKNYTLDIT